MKLAEFDNACVDIDKIEYIGEIIHTETRINWRKKETKHCFDFTINTKSYTYHSKSLDEATKSRDQLIKLLKCK